MVILQRRSPGRALFARAASVAAVVALTASARIGSGQAPPPAADGSARPAATGAAAAGAIVGTELDVSRIKRAARALGTEVAALGGTASVLALDAGSGRVLAALNEHAPMNPASNAKLVTATAALRYLGPAHRFQTGLYGRAAGTSVPELVLRGEGDPSLGMAALRELARELGEAGVREVGVIAVDQGYLDDRYVPPGFDEQPAEWAPFRAPVAAVSLAGNTITFTVRPGKAGEDAKITLDPPGFVELAGAVRTRSKREADVVTVLLEPRGGRLAAKVGGHVREGGAPTRVVKRVEDPRLLAGYGLRVALTELGILAGEVRLGGAGEKTALAVHRSAPLGELLSALGKQSDNFYAEMLFKAIAAERKGRPGTAEAASEIVKDFLGELGALEEGVVFRNGSGLYGGDRTTAHATATLLRAAYADASLRPELVTSLAIGGVDGTLRSRFKRWARVRAVRAKTGTLGAVAALSGYVLAPEGRPPVVFSIFVNGVPGKVAEARVSIDRVVDAIAGELWPGQKP